MLTCPKGEGEQDGGKTSCAAYRRLELAWLIFQKNKSLKPCVSTARDVKSRRRSLSLPAKRKRPRGVVDTSVLVAGIAGFKSFDITPANPSANLLRDWIGNDTFVWLVTDEILLEYK